MVLDRGEYKIRTKKCLRFRDGSEEELSREGGDGGVDRVQGFPVTGHHGVVELLAALHKVFVPLLHVTFGDRLCKIPPGNNLDTSLSAAYMDTSHPENNSQAADNPVAVNKSYLCGLPQNSISGFIVTTRYVINITSYGKYGNV